MGALRPVNSGTFGEEDQRRDGTAQVGDLTIDVWNVLVWVGEEQISLRVKEVELLAVLAAQPEKLVTREDLATLVWGSADALSSRTIDVHVGRLRSALAQKSSHDYVRTVRGYGYRFIPPE